MTRVRWLHYHQSEYLRTKGSVLQFFNWRTAGGPEKDLRTSTGSVLHFFAYSTPSPIKSGPATSSIRGQVQGRRRTSGPAQDQSSIIFADNSPYLIQSGPATSTIRGPLLWRTAGGPQDQHRISSPLFLLTTPPPWSSPVLQHNQLEDHWRTVGGPQDQDLRTSSSSPIRLMHLYRIVLQNSYKTGYFLLFIAIINIIKNQNKWITLNYKILFYVL